MLSRRVTRISYMKDSGHNYAMSIEVAKATVNSKRDRGTTTLTNTPEKGQMEKKVKGNSDETVPEEAVGSILGALEALGKRAPWPRIEKARKEGKPAGFRGPFAYIEGKRISG
ncbi:hypothetical protein GOODEAATRI_033522 [Goodea atripinnis]|uniref:Uncharacterized protein n=1 Tax=Goodea atripinnis TaxID=208336 RepID=A0ABV0Q345_9TELE